jgi:hypothetical protein
MVARKVANPAPAVLTLVNPRRRKSMPARKPRATHRRRSTVHHRANPVRRTRRASTQRVHRSDATRARRRNPLFARHHRRRHGRRRNPVSGAIGQAIPLVGASFAITFAAPIVTRFVGGFLPLGQFQQPVVLAGTGYGLGWVAGKLGFGKYKGPLEIMGVTLGLTALVAPYLRGLMAPAAPANQPQGLRRNMPRGIAVVPPVPPMLAAAPVAANQPRGIASYSTPGQIGFRR